MKQHIDAIAHGTWNEELGRAAYEDSLRSPETVRRPATLDPDRARPGFERRVEDDSGRPESSPELE